MKNKLLRMNIQLLASNYNNDKSLEEQILALQQQLEKMNEIIEKNTQLEDINKKLFTKNQEYFLKITNQNNSSDEEEDEINEYEEYVGKEFYSKLSTKEKNLLHTILEGED